MKRSVWLTRRFRAYALSFGAAKSLTAVIKTTPPIALLSHSTLAACAPALRRPRPGQAAQPRALGYLPVHLAAGRMNTRAHQLGNGGKPQVGSNCSGWRHLKYQQQDWRHQGATPTPSSQRQNRSVHLPVNMSDQSCRDQYGAARIHKRGVQNIRLAVTQEIAFPVQHHAPASSSTACAATVSHSQIGARRG